MKTINIYYCIILLFFSLTIASISIEGCNIGSNNYDPVIQDLENLYNSNTEFKNLIDNALKSAIPPPTGWSNSPYGNTEELYIWPEKDINDLLDFFQNWLHFVPNPTNGMLYYELLYGMCYKNVSAVKFVSTEPGLSWTKKFVEARGLYMDSKASINEHKGAMEMWYTSMGKIAWDRFKPPHPENEGFKGYTTFNEFFTRELRLPEEVPASKSLLAAPADGLVNVINSNLNTDSKIHTKYLEYLNVDQLLNGSKYANRFILR